MKIPVDTVDALFRGAVKKADRGADRFGLAEAVTVINAALPSGYKLLGERYLYDTLYLGIRNARKEGIDTLNLDRSGLDSLAWFLTGGDFDAYREIHQPLISGQSKAIEGNWYSIVRCNTGRPRLLISPVQISTTHEATLLELRGPHRTYRGRITWVAGSFGVHAVSRDGVKMLHLAFGLGVAKSPRVLRGVFSGISSGGLPIAGKEILLRSEQDYAAMTNFIFHYESDKAEEHPVVNAPIADYFADFASCYLRIDSGGAFDLGDLG